MAKIFGIFDNRPLIWFHYVLLVGLLFAGFFIGETYLQLSTKSYVWMFVFWYLIVSIGDQLIHYFLGVD